ncbi:hypothetical protein ACFL6U_05155 [Planctomycetota bacterium]
MKTMNFSGALKKALYILFLHLVLSSMVFAETVGVFFDSKVSQASFAASDIQTALESKGFSVDMQPLVSLNSSYAKKKVVISLANNSAVTALLSAQGGTAPAGLGEQAYALRTTSTPQTSYWVLGGDVNGAMYGGLQVAENIKFNNFAGTYNSQESPYIKKRGIKLNLPMDWRSPTFRGNFGGTSQIVAIANVWDMTFWTQWFDEMARFRYNNLSVWTDHPFTAMLKEPGGYSDVALQDVQGENGKVIKKITIDEKVAFWQQVMEYGHNRGFDFYFIVWNTYTHGATGKHGITNSSKNAVTTAYMRKCMTQFLETYPLLNGWGVTPGEEMVDVDRTAGQAWMWDTYGLGILDYLKEHPERNLAYLNRWGKVVDFTNQSKEVTDFPNVKLEFTLKYSQAHMYSAEIPDYNQKNSFLSDLKQYNWKSWMTIRNDDLYYLHWGDPEFAQAYIKGFPDPDTYTKGFWMGADGYTPTRVFTSKNKLFQGELEIRKFWYMYMIWGRLGYNPNTPDEVFINTLGQKCPQVSSSKLFTAWRMASQGFRLMTELIQGSWIYDGHWYPEACQSGRGFRTIDQMADCKVGRGSNMCSIAISASDSCGSKKSSYQVADSIERYSNEALSLLNEMNAGAETELGINLNNLRALSYLGLYYAEKIRGATYKKAGQTENARDAMEKAYCFWMTYTNLMDSMYTGMNLNRSQNLENWHARDTEVLKEYTDLGGSGTPSCDVVGNTSGQATSTHLWDRGPSLFEIARTVTIERPLHPTYPQPDGLWGGNSPNLCTPQMKMSLWGPPERITLSMGKTDVWDRRKGWEKPVTLSEIRRGAFSVANKNDEAVPGWAGKQIKIMHPDGGFWNPYASWNAYSFPCPKPVGQAIILTEDFKEMNQPVTGKTQCHNGLTTVSLDHGDTHANIEYLPLMNEATTAIRASFSGLTKPVSVRLYRHEDIFRNGIFQPSHWHAGPRLEGYDYEKDSSWNGPLDPPKAGKDNNYFWIHQKLPAEKTFPNGFEYYLVGRIIGTDVEVETVEDEFNLGTPLFGLKSRPVDYELMRKAPGAAATALLPEQKNLQFTVLITVVTTNDGSNSDLINIAKQRLESAEKLGMNSLIAENSNWYNAHYDKREHGRIFTGSIEDTRKQIPSLY